MTDREAMKMALKDFKHIFGMRFSLVTNAISKGNIERLEAALAQPKIPMSPEHLPQYIATNNIKPTTEGGGGGGGGAQPEQKPVDIHCPSCLHSFSIVPVAKPWVGLHLDDMPEEHVVDRSFLRGARWAEAKLKAKNGG